MATDRRAKAEKEEQDKKTTQAAEAAKEKKNKETAERRCNVIGKGIEVDDQLVAWCICGAYAQTKTKLLAYKGSMRCKQQAGGTPGQQRKSQASPAGTQGRSLHGNE
eukprot:4718114-Amphidinium_carterae.1